MKIDGSVIFTWVIKVSFSVVTLHCVECNQITMSGNLIFQCQGQTPFLGFPLL